MGRVARDVTRPATLTAWLVTSRPNASAPPSSKLASLSHHDWSVEGAAWISFEAARPTIARDLAHAMLATELEVTSDRFDVEVDDADVTTLTPPRRDGQVYGG